MRGNRLRSAVLIILIIMHILSINGSNQSCFDRCNQIHQLELLQTLDSAPCTSAPTYTGPVSFNFLPHHELRATPSIAWSGKWSSQAEEPSEFTSVCVQPTEHRDF